ncbi:hypothetical protein U9M48_011429 [Paspalum notatum var. saurae]|uniref:F-box domain-containing protein n=1 Tax=Paspalum notatum var. saurae TaxID=547442 RepID=A0AAQ3SX10_PASNO
MEDLPPGFLSLGRGPRAPAPAFPTPPPLLDEIVEEILLRVPPSDPALLLRAAAVCRRWAGLATDAGFRRRYAGRHRAPPMLGYFGSLIDTAGSARFFPTTGASSFRPRIADRCGYRAHDARAGRVLLNRIAPPSASASSRPQEAAAALVVWDPLTADRWDLPLLSRPQQVRSWNAAVVASPLPGPFRVAFVGLDADQMFAHVYSSASGSWGEAAAATGALPDDPAGDRLDETMTGAQAGDAVYFALAGGTGVVRFHLGARTLSIVPLPDRPYPARIVLRAMDGGGGGLGFAEVDLQSTLRIWAMDDAGQWVVSRAVELGGMQLPAQVSSVYYVVASADAAGVLFLCTNHGLYTYDLQSGHSIKVWSNRFQDIVPYEGFYTPVLRRALTVEGPSAGA